MKNTWTEKDGVVFVDVSTPKNPQKTMQIDAADWPIIASLGGRVAAQKNGATFYARCKGFSVHRLVLGLVKGQLADHKNCDGLDNRRSNIRAATSSQNHMNRRKIPGTLSRFKGVSFDKRKGKWCATLQLNGGQRWIGYFTDEADAAKAYDRDALRFFGDRARLNF